MRKHQKKITKLSMQPQLWQIDNRYGSDRYVIGAIFQLIEDDSFSDFRL